MLLRFEVGLKPHVRDVVGENVARKIKSELGVDVDSVRMIHVFTVDGISEEQARVILERAALHDPVLHEVSLTPLAEAFDWNLEVGFRPGVTDNEGRTARETLRIVLGLDDEEYEHVKVYTSKQHLMSGSLDEETVQHIAKDLLCNELIQRYELRSAAQWANDEGFEAKAAKVTGEANSEIAIIDLCGMNDEEMMAYSRANTLALSLEEMHIIREYYTDADVIAERKERGLPANPTDGELEVLAQTWSEHCKHKIFSSKITYNNTETGKTSVIDSLYKTYIQGSTKVMRERMGDDDFCLSVFKDNAGVLRFNDNMHVCIKVETHNSPSALDPYGGALTGIVGVNRDPMGTGMGANLLCNTNVFCFADPYYEEELPPRLLHPRRVFEGVREGVEHGGNKSGVPTVNGSIVFEERYLGKPLVYCGTIGTMPIEVKGKPSYEKESCPGDIIVMCGGKIGADGIHGATFSSEELHEGSPATAVQIGDPITQRKMYDFLMRARDLGLYNAITDNGAGGLASSVGEMAEGPGGCDMDLAKAPLKYDGLRPWEILVSEAQERMTLSVSEETIDEFMALAKEMDVEATALGNFNDSGRFLVRYNDKVLTDLSMDFLHDGVPQMQLQAKWERPEIASEDIPAVADQAELLGKMLGRLNICSKEYVVRQYDHEVQGKSVVKPMVGVKNDGPSDAGVIRPDFNDEKGLVISHGICPQFSDLDTYWMMALAIDEAVRNAVAVGGDINHMAGCDNFCWCDPVESESTPDGQYKLAQLVRANEALAHYCQAYGVPCVSGKDSMKNDYKGGGVKISIPPTVLFSLMGVVPDINKCTTSDFKKEGDAVYILGRTFNELGGSELAQELGVQRAEVPQVDALSARKRFETVFQSAQKSLHNSCHDLSDGGLGVAVAEMCIGGRLGAEINLDEVPVCGDLGTVETLYSESASRFLVSVPAENCAAFEEMFAGQCFAKIGHVGGTELKITSGDSVVIQNEVTNLTDSFKETLNW
ncbi:MAG: AIR synthase-related protein [Desulfovibrio sp.]